MKCVQVFSEYVIDIQEHLVEYKVNNFLDKQSPPQKNNKKQKQS